MGWLEDTIQKLLDSVSETVRKFTSYSMMLFFLGTIYGFYLDKIAAFTRIDGNVLIMIPLVLAILAYYVTEIAVLLFLLLLGLILGIFL
ncbi:MAG TPA: hypothetical protein VI875_02410 [Candidatus Norongarragalinales archaeon]|nr:hypothetical protein [Candidatus Norongarragalinales archaeon]